MIKQFTYNDEMHQWERVDNVQYYRGVEIKTITYHFDYWDASKIRNHREYHLTYPNGTTGIMPINKRMGMSLREFINYELDRSIGGVQ